MLAVLGKALQLLFGSILLILLGAVLLYSLYMFHLRNKYGHIPIPQPINFFLGHIPIIKKRSAEQGNTELLLCEWTQKYGNTFLIFMLSEVMIITCHPESIKELMVTGDFPKSRRYNLISWTFGERVLGRGLVTELDHENWSVRRLGMNPAFHRVVLKDLMTEFNTASDNLVNVLGSHADKTDDILLGPLMHKTTLDVIGKVAFGKDLGCLKNNGSPFSKAIFDLMIIINASIMDPTLKLPFRGKAYKAQIKEVMHILRQTAKEWFEERKEALERGDYIPDDILTHMMKLRESTELMTDDIMIDDFITFFVAGQETTANATSFMLMETGRHPEIMRRLQEEVDEVIGQKPHISFEDVTKLEYMSLVWKETLRMYSIVPVSFRDINRDGYKIEKYDIPRDSIVMMSSFISSRNPKLVNDPLTFKPERFLPDSPDRPNTYAYFPFALGPRNCIGQTFAQLEGKVIMAKILQNFKYELDPEQSFDILETASLKPKGRVKAKISWRK